MELTLMCQDREVAAFSLDLETGRVLAVRPLSHASEAPLSVCLTGPDPADDLARFLARRTLSPWRRDLDQILEATHASSALQLALRAHGLTLSDPYWYRAADDTCTWKDIDFRRNNWDPAFGEAVIAQDWEALATASCMVPDVTSTGFAPKAWIQTDEGPRLLKAALGALGIDPVGEVLASRLATRILPTDASTPYDLVRRGTKLFSSCPLITAPDEELVSVRAFTERGFKPDGSPNRPAVWDKDTRATCAEVLEAAGISETWPYIAQLTTCAALAIQTDLHLGNCGIIRNVRTGAVRTAPLFDFGSCFGTAVNSRGIDMAVAMPQLAERYLAPKLRQLEPSWDYGWYDHQALDGFRAELEDALLQEALLSPGYVAIILDLFDHQRVYVDGMARRV